MTEHAPERTPEQAPWHGKLISRLEEGDIVAVLRRRGEGPYWIPRPSELKNRRVLVGEVLKQEDRFYRYISVPTDNGLTTVVSVQIAPAALATVWYGEQPPDGFVPSRRLNGTAPTVEDPPAQPGTAAEVPAAIDEVWMLIEVDPHTSTVRAIPLSDDAGMLEFLREGGEVVLRVSAAKARRLVDTQLEFVQVQKELMALSAAASDTDA
jgi:hypothetical protein